MPKKKTTKRLKLRSPIQALKPFASRVTINVVVETTKGKRTKLKFDKDLRCFRLGNVLPAGSAFPYDFGFVPGTKAQDGDPLDVLLIMDESTYPGCLVEARPIGVIEAETSEDGKWKRNDRVVAVAQASNDHRDLRTIKDLSPCLLREVESFFESYHKTQGKKFKLLATRGPKRAIAAVKKTAKQVERRSV
jgi:inorganic pyrophosphatase